MPLPSEQLTLAVLAGGEGSRMGGPKAWLRVKGEPILEFLLRRWNWPGPTMLVIAPNREPPPGAEKFDLVIVDEQERGGPLVGVVSALRASETPRVVFATCDMPGLEKSHLEFVAGALGDQLGVLCRRGERIEPFPSAFATAARDAIEEQLARGNRAMHALLDLEGLFPFDVDWDDSVWKNLNYPQDLELI